MDSRFSEIEYEERFYGFNRSEVVNFVTDSIMTNIESAVESFSCKLILLYDEEAVKAFSSSLLGAYRTALQSRSKEIEKVVNDYFTISANIVHPDDQIHDELPDDEESRLDRQIEAEERKYLALCVMERNMKNILSDMLRDEEKVALLNYLPHAAQDLQNKTRELVSSLEHLPLDQILSNLNLN